MDGPSDAVVVIALVPDTERTVAFSGFVRRYADFPTEIVDVDFRADSRVGLPLAYAVFKALPERGTLISAQTAADGDCAGSASGPKRCSA
jgi:hypothetical protein